MIKTKGQEAVKVGWDTIKKKHFLKLENIAVYNVDKQEAMKG